MAPPEPLTVAVLRENKNRWERRTACTPSNVRELVAQGIRVLVQPSTLRVVRAGVRAIPRARPPFRRVNGAGRARGENSANGRNRAPASRK